MAKFGAYYGLCPLIDHHSLLGIVEDHDKGVVVVTVGKNIAIKYKVSDQKQLCSWRSREKFSAPIVYDNEMQRYATAVNQTYIRTWYKDEEYYDKLRKYKFSEQIYSLFVCNNKCYVLFRNGAIVPLNKAIDDKKLVLDNVIDLEQQEYIFDFKHIQLRDTVYVCLIVRRASEDFLLWTTFDEENRQTNFNRISLTRTGTELTGYGLHHDGNEVSFLSLWSDSRMYTCQLKFFTDTQTSGCEDLFTVLDTISCKHYVSMLSLDENYIALYGGNSNEEGAILMIYNVQFKVIQAKLNVKMFTIGARLWRVDNNLFLPIGQNLAVVPFNLETEQLASLVGSHKISTNLGEDADVRIVHKMVHADWGTNSNNVVHKSPSTQTVLGINTDQGLPESLIFEERLPKLLEEKDLAVIRQYMQLFNDTPEKCLVKLLKFFITADTRLFKPDKIKSESEKLPETMQPLQRSRLVNSVLQKRFSDVLIVPHLCFELELAQVTVLLEYIAFCLLSAEEHLLPSLNSIETESKLLDWSSVLIDANYQKFLLSKDDKIFQIFASFRSLVEEKTKCLDEMKQLEVLMLRVQQGKQTNKGTRLGSASYFVEEITLY